MRVLIAGCIVALAVTAMATAPRTVRAAGSARDQITPAVVYNPDTDDYLAIWAEDRGAGADLYAKRLFTNGLPEGGAGKGGSLVFRDADPRQQHGPRSSPAIVYNKDLQEYVVAWAEQRTDADGMDIWVQRVSSAGFARGSARMIAGGLGDQSNPSVTHEPTQQLYFVVWSDNALDIDGIYGMKLRANGIPMKGRMTLVQGQFNAQDPTIALRGDDGYLLAWVDDRDGKPSIYARRINGNGIPVGGKAGLDYPIAYGPDDQTAPALDPLAGTLVYNVYNAATGFDVVGLQVYDNGTTRGARGIGIAVPAADQADPSVANNSARGEVLVLYSDNRSGQFDLYAIRVQNSRPRGKDFAVVVDGANS